MKSEELMISDLVIHGFGGIGKITEIDSKTVVIKDDGFDTGDGMNEVSFALNELKPIPLTPEILEKNGFELKGSGWLWCEDKDVETQNYSFVQFRRNKEVRIVEINFLNKAVTKFRNVQNVHELQHALRLCGIDKEIEI